MDSNKKGVDISNITDQVNDMTKEDSAQDSNPGLEPDLPDLNVEEVSDEELFKELQEADPILAMITAKLSDLTNVLVSLTARVNDLQSGVTYLLSRDKDYMARVQEIQDQADACENCPEDTNDRKTPTP